MRGQAAMPIGKVGKRRNVVIPQDICDEVGLQEGDFVEVLVVDGNILIKPKKLIDASALQTERGLQPTNST
jgi:AbrB family looped-hinge helix DNA binding protein